MKGEFGRKPPVTHPATSWLFEHTSLLQNASVKGEDGLTARALVRRRAFGQRLIGFGELVLWKQLSEGLQHDAEGNMGPRLLPSIFLGYRGDANTYVIGLENGKMVSSRAVTRRPMADRWEGELVEGIAETPWTTRTTAPAAGVEFGDAADAHPARPGQLSLPRRLKATMKILKQHGTTDGCPQCKHIRAFSERKAGVQHSEECRKRIAGSLAATAAGADRIARSELRTNRGIEAASRPDQPRGGDMVRTVTDQAAEMPHTNVAGPHPRDASVANSGSSAAAYRASLDVCNARRARETVQDDAATHGASRTLVHPERGERWA